MNKMSKERLEETSNDCHERARWMKEEGEGEGEGKGTRKVNQGEDDQLSTTETTRSSMKRYGVDEW